MRDQRLHPHRPPPLDLSDSKASSECPYLCDECQSQVDLSLPPALAPTEYFPPTQLPLFVWHPTSLRPLRIELVLEPEDYEHHPWLLRLQEHLDEFADGWERSSRRTP